MGCKHRTVCLRHPDPHLCSCEVRWTEACDRLLWQHRGLLGMEFWSQDTAFPGTHRGGWVLFFRGSLQLLYPCLLRSRVKYFKFSFLPCFNLWFSLLYYCSYFATFRMISTILLFLSLQNSFITLCTRNSCPSLLQNSFMTLCTRNNCPSLPDYFFFCTVTYICF